MTADLFCLSVPISLSIFIILLYIITISYVIVLVNNVTIIFYFIIFLYIIHIIDSFPFIYIIATDYIESFRQINSHRHRTPSSHGHRKHHDGHPSLEQMSWCSTQITYAFIRVAAS